MSNVLKGVIVKKEGQKAIFSGLKIMNQSIRMVSCKIPNMH